MLVIYTSAKTASIKESWIETGNKPINSQDGNGFFVRIPKYKDETKIMGEKIWMN
jgi:hypothetical protein